MLSHFESICKQSRGRLDEENQQEKQSYNPEQLCNHRLEEFRGLSYDYLYIFVLVSLKAQLEVTSSGFREYIFIDHVVARL